MGQGLNSDLVCMQTRLYRWTLFIHWDLLKVDLFFLFDVFEQTFGFFCHYYSFVDLSWNVLRLDMFGIRWCMFVDKGQQGTVILFVQSIGFLGWIIK